MPTFQVEQCQSVILFHVFMFLCHVCWFSALLCSQAINHMQPPGIRLTQLVAQWTRELCILADDRLAHGKWICWHFLGICTFFFLTFLSQRVLEVSGYQSSFYMVEFRASLCTSLFCTCFVAVAATMRLDADHNGDAIFEYCPHSQSQTVSSRHRYTAWFNFLPHCSLFAFTMYIVNQTVWTGDQWYSTLFWKTKRSSVVQVVYTSCFSGRSSRISWAEEKCFRDRPISQWTDVHAYWDASNQHQSCNGAPSCRDDLPRICWCRKL